MQSVQRIEPVTGLCVGQCPARLHIEPEIGEPVGKGTALGAVDAFQLTAADNQCMGMLQIGLQEERNIFRVVLSVTVKGYRIGEALLQGRPEACLQRMALASVPHIRHHRDVLNRMENAEGIVRTAVSNDDDIVAVAERSLHHCLYRPAIIISRNDDTDASASQSLLQLLVHHTAFITKEIFAIALPPAESTAICASTAVPSSDRTSFFT